ncbi:unnamed protein product [Somion occarium]|uniref:Uncharacterized protein n=1 Tax=Somion occarium TaxID=3059160 RepID=A0ABP1CUU6_9APHY
MTRFLCTPIGKNVKAAYKRIINTRFALTFFTLCLIHCLAQGLLLAFTFRIDRAATDLVTGILQTAEVPRTILPWHHRKNGQDTLKLCSQIPGTVSYDPCITVFGDAISSSANWTVPGPFRRMEHSRSPPSVHGVVALTIEVSRNEGGNINGVFVGDGTSSGMTFLDEQCTRVLLYPMQILNNAKREDVVLLASQFWLLGISIFSILCGSIPHLLAVFCMRILSTSWSAYTLWRTKDIQRRFLNLLVNPDSPCHYDFFPTYFRTRLSFQIPELVLACSASMFTTYFGWRLMKIYKAHTFKRVGPPDFIVQMYRSYLAIFVCLHLSVFLVIAAMALWADQLINGAIAAISTHTAIYYTLLLATIITLIPWILLTSRAVRREHRGLMVLVLTTCFIYIACWSIMFYSQVYRWTWIQWPFFASMTLTSLLVLIGCGILGIICWLNFDKGLAQYLHAENALAETDFEPEMFANELGSESGHGHGLRDSRSASPRTQFSLSVDTNWDFMDIKRPPIYLVDMQKDHKFRTMPR